MQDNQPLLNLLRQSSPGMFYSGTYLGEQMGISRVAVQKRIQCLTNAGLPIEAVHGKGYRLAEGVHLLDCERIDLFLKQNQASTFEQKIKKIQVMQSVDSTNSELMAQTIDIKSARVCLSEAQAQGRGRSGNQWVSAPYRNIMMSMSWGFPHWPQTITGLGLAISLVVAERLNEMFDLSVKIKWPNDLMVDNKKLAGVLVDVKGESGGSCNIVIGLGLNVHQPQWQDQEQQDYQWQDLMGLGVIADRNELAALIVRDWISMLEEFDKVGFAHFAPRWNKLSSYAGKRIAIKKGEQVLVQGDMLGVNEAGGIMVRDDKGETHCFVDSSVSVRLL